MKQLTGGRQRPKYRLSPNEVEQLKKEETERRRKLRIVQVREQSKIAAANIRHNVKLERKRQLLKLAHEVEDDLEKEKQEEVRRLEQQYENTLRTIGQGHTQAILTDKRTFSADKHVTAHKNQERAEERHKEALRKVALDKAYKQYEETKPFRDRQAALMEEKKRAAEVAARPPPPPDPISEAVLNKNKLKRPVPLTDMNAFSATHYHIPDFAVEKAPAEQQHDGKTAGEEEDQRTKEEISERRKKEHDQLIRARIRGNEALKKEKLKHEYDALMADLSLQQRADRRQRQLVVSKLPKQVFIPPDRRMEELEDKQMEMERAFEDMYLKQMNLSGDFSLTFDPNPLPQTPVDNSLEVNEDSSIIVPSMPAFNPALRELTNVSRTEGQTTQQGKPETVLKKLLNKIKEQRSEVDQEPTQVEDQDLKAAQKEVYDAERDVTEARMPTSKPSADPQLDLSPLKVPGNEKPLRNQDMVLEREKEDQEESSSLADNGETHFLQQLQHRLQAIEVQKDHLDRMMKERQQKSQPVYTSDGRLHPSVLPGSSQFPATLGGPQGLTQVPASFHPRPSTVALSGGPAGDVGTLAGSGLKGPNQRDLSTLPHSASAAYNPVHLPSSLASQNAVSMSVQSDWGQTGEGQSVFWSGRPVGQRLLGAGYPESSGQHSVSQPVPPSDKFSQSAPAGGTGGIFTNGAASSAQFQGLSARFGSSVSKAMQFQTNVSSVLAQFSSVPPRSVGSVPPVSVAWLSSLSASSGTLTAGGLKVPLTGTGFQAPSFLPASSMMPQIYSQGVVSFPASQPSTVLASTGGIQSGLTTVAGSLKVLGPTGSLASQLAPGGEEERLRKVREYQQQLIVKHQEKMKSLQDVRTSIEMRQSQADALGVSSTSSASQRSTDPVFLVPYTLKPSLFQQETSSASSSSVTTGLPAGAGMSLTSGPGAYPVSSGFSVAEAGSIHRTDRLAGSSEAGPGRFLGAEPSSTKGTAPLSGLESADVSAGRESILAGSVGVLGTRDVKPASVAGGVQSLLVSYEGERPQTTSSATGGKLDSVRKSLPFDNMDNVLLSGQAEGEAAGDTDRVSMGDDSHLSSSTERGSPALGSRSNKSSISGKSGSGLSAMSDGSLGGSSLVARAEEKRQSFEQRQRELQDQLAEIQRQKDALLQRYHGNQQRMSAQEESLRSKLKTAKAEASSSAPPSLLHYPASAAVSLGMHQSASPSMELEERSLCSERLSTGRSWAMELEEYSLPHSRSGEGTFKSPASMTLEEISITSDRSSGGSAAQNMSKATDRLVTDARPGSTISSLEEFSIVSSRQSVEGEERSLQPSFSARESHESLSARRVSEPASRDLPDSAKGRLDIRDLMHELGSGRLGEDSGENVAASSTWSDVHSTHQPPEEEDGAETRLPPPPTHQPVAVVDYEPHELSTILEVDTPQTGHKTTTTTRVTPTDSATAGEGGEKPASRRYIEFSRHGAATEDDRESKLSASGSSASSEVRSVIEVRTGILKSGETLSATDSGNDTSFSLRGDEKRFREHILESSSMKGTAFPQGAHLQDHPSQEVSYASSGQGFQSLELTLDSLTPRSVSVEDSQARRFLDFSGKEPAPQEGGGGGGRTEEVLRQARQFNQELMAAIQRQSADVFDQSSLSSMADHSQGSHQSGQGDAQ